MNRILKFAGLEIKGEITRFEKEKKELESTSSAIFAAKLEEILSGDNSSDQQKWVKAFLGRFEKQITEIKQLIDANSSNANVDGQKALVMKSQCANESWSAIISVEPNKGVTYVARRKNPISTNFPEIETTVFADKTRIINVDLERDIKVTFKVYHNPYDKFFEKLGGVSSTHSLSFGSPKINKHYLLYPDGHIIETHELFLSLDSNWAFLNSLGRAAENFLKKLIDKLKGG